MVNGIFCLEGFWYGPKDRTSVQPVLDLLQRTSNIKSQYHRCGTNAEVEFMLKRWRQKGFQKDFPIIYLAAHGSEHCLHFEAKNELTLDRIAEMLGDRCERSIFFFGSCSTLNTDKRHVKRFLKKTRGLAAVGYSNDVDWLLSSSLEILVLNFLSSCSRNTQDMQKSLAELSNSLGKFSKELKFRIVLNDREHFPKKRTRKATDTAVLN